MAAFSNKNNQITLKGIVFSDIEEIPNNSYGVTFTIKVFRPAEVGKEQRYDIFAVAVYDKQNVNIVCNNLTRGIGLKVKGELRTWMDGSFKICANKIEPIW